MIAPRKDETLFEYWISFWPTAPLFGVRWRFEGMVPTPDFLRPGETAAQMAAASAEEAVRAADSVVETLLHASESSAQYHETEGAPEVDVEPEPAEAADGRPATLYDAPPRTIDDLKLIKGVGPKLEALLHELGIYRFEQIATFTESDLAWIDRHLTTFRGRPLRDDWPGQARALL